MLNYLFVSLILSLSFFVVVDDIRYKKIKNKSLILGASFGLVLFAVFLLGGGISVSYVENVLINSGIALVVSFGLWKWGIWPAGDAKLFALFSFLLPLEFYSKSYLAYFPALSFLVNSFVMILFFIFIKSSFLLVEDFICESKKKGFIKNVFSILDKKIYKFNERIHEKRKLFKDSLRFILVLIIYIFVIKFYLRFYISPASFIEHLIVIALIFMFFESYIDKFSIELISVDELAEKMNLTDKSIKKIKNIPVMSSQLGAFRPDGLSLMQVKIIKKYAYDKGVGGLYVYRTIPFSPWIIAGLLVTMILRANILSLIF